jgi:hypothetical protein
VVEIRVRRGAKGGGEIKERMREIGGEVANMWKRTKREEEYEEQKGPLKERRN